MTENGSPVAPLVLEVRGRPIPQGSMRAFAIQNKTTGKFRGVVAQGGSKERRDALAEWRGAVRDSVFAALGVRELAVAHFVETPLVVEITFRLDRPAAHFGTGKNAGKLKPAAPMFPTGAPDVDKLARATLDALKGTAFDDDSRVVDVHPRKRYALDGQGQGATIRIRAATAADLLETTPANPGAAAIRSAFLGARDPKPANPADLEGPDMDDHTTPATPEVDAPPRPPRKRKTQQERIREIIGGSQIEAEIGVFGKTPQPHHRPARSIEETIAAGVAEEIRRHGTPELRALVESAPPQFRILSESDTRPCDGDHALPRCSDPECWRDDASFAVMTELVERDPFLRAAVADRVAAAEDLDSVIKRGDRGELARRLLSAPPGSLEERRCIAALAPAGEDDFG